MNLLDKRIKLVLKTIMIIIFSVIKFQFKKGSYMVSSKKHHKRKAVKVSFNGASTVGYFHDRRFLFPSNKPHPVSTIVSIFFFFYLMFVVCEIEKNLAAFFLMVTSRYFLKLFLGKAGHFIARFKHS